MNSDLRNLLLATNLGKSRYHPLAGWNILTILYGNRTSADIPRTLGFLVEQYNANYLDSESEENLITDAVIKSVLKTLEEDAKFIEVSPRKIRVRMTSGAYHMQNAPVYRITSQGIEYLSMLPKVLDAESTVTANTARIKEYCDLLNKLNSEHLDTSHTQLFNDFYNMVSAYSDVMKGMHKLSEDLEEVSNDLAFNHGGKIAEHLNQMLTEKAVPAYVQLISQGSVIQDLNRNSIFPDQVARSRQGEDSLEVDQAIDNRTKLSVQIHRDKSYVKTQLQNLSNSFDPTSTGIDSNFDSIYLIFNTIKDSIDLLSNEYDHINAQTIDVKQLTKQIDELLTHYQNISIPVQLPRHLAQDREISDSNDLLEAETLGPVIYQANSFVRQVATAEDNPEVANDDEIIENYADALKEFQNIVMIDDKKGQVDRNLELENLLTRDEIVRLYSATNYNHYESFAPFGRPVKSVKRIIESKAIWIHCKKEQYSVQLPSGFYFNF